MSLSIWMFNGSKKCSSRINLSTSKDIQLVYKDQTVVFEKLRRKEVFNVFPLGPFMNN